MHSAIHSGTLPARVLRYQTPIADAARERTRQLMASHLRNVRCELLSAMFIFAGLGFAVACQL